MADPAVRNVAIQAAAGAIAISATSGDTLVACVTSENSDPTVTGGGNTWTRVAYSPGSGYAQRTSIFTSPVTSTGSKSVTVGGTGVVMMTLYAIQDADSVDGDGVGTGNGTSQAIAGLTTAADGDLLVAAWATLTGIAGAGSYTTPTGMTERADFSRTGGYGQMMSATQTLASAGATGTRTSTASPGTYWGAAMVALAGAAAGRPVHPVSQYSSFH